MVREHDETPVTLADGHTWSEYILDKWQEQNGLYPDISVLQNLIHVLPQIYETLELFGYHKLARKLEKSVQSL